MDEARRLRHKRGVLKTARMMESKGISYEFALLSLVGLRGAARFIDMTHYTTEQRRARK